MVTPARGRPIRSDHRERGSGATSGGRARLVGHDHRSPAERGDASGSRSHRLHARTAPFARTMVDPTQRRKRIRPNSGTPLVATIDRRWRRDLRDISLRKNMEKQLVRGMMALGAWSRASRTGSTPLDRRDGRYASSERTDRARASFDAGTVPKERVGDYLSAATNRRPRASIQRAARLVPELRRRGGSRERVRQRFEFPRYLEGVTRRRPMLKAAGHRPSCPSGGDLDGQLSRALSQVVTILVAIRTRMGSAR